MNLFTPAEITLNYAKAGKVKAERTFGKMFILAILAGTMIAFGAAFSNTAVHAMENVGLARLVSGLLFPFGLIMVMLTGAELFTGNCLIGISVLSKQTTAVLMARNLVIVYLGNFVGSLIVAFVDVYCGQLNYSSGALAVYTIKIAAAKCGIGFFQGLGLGVFCNVLVCLGVILSLSAKDTAGRAIGAFVPVSIFVTCGFEHCIANMYYIPAGMMAMSIPKYAALAAEAGIDTTALSMGNFLVGNMVPVTIGNIIGGVLVGAIMWAGHVYEGKEKAR